MIAIAGVLASAGAALSMLLRAQRTIPEEGFLSAELYIGIAGVHGALLLDLAIVPALAALALALAHAERPEVETAVRGSPSRSGARLLLWLAALAPWLVLLGGALAIASVLVPSAAPAISSRPVLPLARGGMALASGLGPTADLLLIALVLAHAASFLSAAAALARTRGRARPSATSAFARQCGLAALAFGLLLLLALELALLVLRREPIAIYPGSGYPGEPDGFAAFWLALISAADRIHLGGLGLLAASIIETVLETGGADRPSLASPLVRPRLGNLAFALLALAIVVVGVAHAVAVVGKIDLSASFLSRSAVAIGILLAAGAAGIVAWRWSVLAARGPSSPSLLPAFSFACGSAMLLVVVSSVWIIAFAFFGGVFAARGSWLEVASLHAIGAGVGVAGLFTGLHAWVGRRSPGAVPAPLVYAHLAGTILFVPVLLVLFAALGLSGEVRHSPGGGAATPIEWTASAAAILVLVTHVLGGLGLVAGALLGGGRAEPAGELEGR